MIKFKTMTPDELRAWIEGNNYNLTSFCRLMQMNRRVLQRRLNKRFFTPSYGFMVTLFCIAYDLGYRVDGMGDPTILPGNAGKGRPRKLAA